MNEHSPSQQNLTPDVAWRAPCPMPSNDSLVAAISAALKERCPDDKLRKAWIGRRADECGIKERTFQRAFYGEGAVDSEAVALLIWRFGQDFFNQTIGAAVGLEADRVGNLGHVRRSLDRAMTRARLIAIKTETELALADLDDRTKREVA